MKAAVKSQFEDMAKEAEKRKLGLVTFNDQVKVLGDCCAQPMLIKGNELNDEHFLEKNGKASADVLLQKPIGEAKEFLMHQLNQVGISGRTALGPALLTSIALAS